jgi:hypothetical protein
MLNDRRVRWLGALLLMTLIAIIVGITAYRMGMAQGLALGMAQVERGPGGAAYPYAWHAHGWYGGPGPWGHGFGFGFIVPLLMFFAFFVAVRMLFWRGFGGPRRGWRGPRWGGPWHRHRRYRQWRDFDRDFDRDDDRYDDRRPFDDDWQRRGTTL